MVIKKMSQKMSHGVAPEDGRGRRGVPLPSVAALTLDGAHHFPEKMGRKGAQPARL
jgi:hypothetical protein